jgi:hypothetical protein
MSSKSSGKRLLGGRTNGTITVIDSRFHRSSARNAKKAFYLTLVIVGLLMAAIAAERMHPIAALFVGVFLALPLAALAWTVVRIWPVLRLIWWWLPEIVLSSAAIYGWTMLAMATNTVVTLAVLAVVVGVPASVRGTRRRIVAWAWCLIVRHRLRTCFAQFMAANQSGSLPLIGIARPTPVGERVTIWLRPGLSITDLESRLEKLAVGCNAATVTVEKASQTNAAKVRLDIKRRQVLTTGVSSPLADLVDETDTTNIDKTGTDNTESIDNAVDPAELSALVALPTALDLPDVTKPPTSGGNGTAGSTNGRTRKGSKASADTAPISTSGTTNGGPVVTGGSDDLSDWI